MKKIWIVLLVAGSLVACVTIDTAKWTNDSYVTQLADIESQKWSKVYKQPITGDRFGELAEAHLGPEGFRVVYINSIGKAVSMGKADFPYPNLGYKNYVSSGLSISTFFTYSRTLS